MIALHKNKGKSVAACLKSRTDYAQNPDKTQQGELVSSYECSPLTVDEEFMLSKRQYELMTGRRQKNDVIAYQIRQSFKPGEITAEEANKVGYELAMRFTKGKYLAQCAACIQRMQNAGFGLRPTSSCKQCLCIYKDIACRYNVIDETKIVSSKTVIWLCRFPKHSNIEVLTGAESGKTACLVSIQELLTA